MWQTRCRKALTSRWCLLQMSLWKDVFSQSSMLQTCSTLLENQQMERCCSEAPSTKLSLLSSHGELKRSRLHRLGCR